MRKGDKKLIELNGQKVEAVFAGKGRFSTCYRIGDKVFSFVKDYDPSKEILAQFVNSNPYLPAVEYEEYRDDEIKVYSMPYYFPLTAEASGAWQEYKHLKELWEKALRSTDIFVRDTIDQLSKFRDLIENDSNMSQDLKEALDQLIYNAHNYDQMLFEFAPRNLMVDANGHLILLDVLFSRSLLIKKLTCFPHHF